MRLLRFSVRLLLASAIASATAGLLGVFLLTSALAAVQDGGFGIGGALSGAVFGLMVGGFAVIPAAKLLTIPAMLAGGSLWMLARRFDPARRKGAFASMGVLMGGISWALLAANDHLPVPAGPGAAEVAMILPTIVFLVAGACCGLVFRSAMIVIGTFFGDEDHELGGSSEAVP